MTCFNPARTRSVLTIDIDTTSTPLIQSSPQSPTIRPDRSRGSLSACIPPANAGADARFQKSGRPASSPTRNSSSTACGPGSTAARVSTTQARASTHAAVPPGSVAAPGTTGVPGQQRRTRLHARSGTAPTT
eukprot:864789-Rhodomonas_salina.2